MELWGKDAAFRGSVCPAFYTRSGETAILPREFQIAAAKVTSAVACTGCRHCHLLEPKLTGVDAANASSLVERRDRETLNIGAA